MKKVIRLTESDLINIIERVIKESSEGLPILPDRLYNVRDFVDSTASIFTKDLPKLIGKRVGIMNYGSEGPLEDYINDPVALCRRIGKDTDGGYRPILYPMTKSDSPSKYPPLKYVCAGTDILKVVGINKSEAELIAMKKDGVNYLKTLDKQGNPYLVKRRLS
jgi:hypothetical protein